MPTSISGTAGVTYPAGGLANTAGAGVGTTDSQTLTNKTLTSPTLTTPNIDSAQIATVSGTAPLYMCRAWVNFDGTKDTTGAVSTANTNRLIRASGNVTSVLRNGTGDYTITFTTALANANYAFLVTPTSSATAANGNAVRTVTTISTSAFRFVISNGSAIADVDYVNVAIFL